MILACYKATSRFPADERFSLVSQIRRAASSVLLNIAEGSSRKSSAERARFYEVSSGSLIEVDAAFDIANGLIYLEGMDLTALNKTVNRCFQLLTGR
jgi:four helix bundle protein